jgi:hypothetical protein
MKMITFMAKTVLATGLLLAGIGANAQDSVPKPAREDVKTRLYHVKNVDPFVLGEALSPFVRNSGVIVVPSRELKTLTISGNPAVLDAIESMIRELDVAPPQTETIEFTAYLLAASAAGSGDQKLPGALAPVMKQLYATFQYRSYRLLDTVLIRNLAGRSGSSTGVVEMPELAGQNGNYSLRYASADITRDSKGTVIHIRDLQMMLHAPKLTKAADGSSLTTFQDAGFSTSIDAKEGQMVVVGKTSYETGDKALIAILTAKVID